MKNKLLDTC